MFGKKRKIKKVIDQLTSTDAHTREDGLLALDTLNPTGHPELGPPLREIAQNQAEITALRAAAAQRLVFVEQEAGLELLQEFLADADAGLRWRARNLLGQLLSDDAAAANLHRNGLEDPDPFARLQAAYELSQRDPSFDLTPTLRSLKDAEDPAIRIEVVKLATIVPPSEAIKAVIAELLEDADEGVRSFALMTGAMLGIAELPT